MLLLFPYKASTSLDVLQELKSNPTKPMKRLVITLAICAISITAAEAKSKDQEERFVKYDKNHDGFVSKKEFIAHAKNKQKASADFAKKDKNGDGKLSLQEFIGHHKKKKAV